MRIVEKGAKKSRVSAAMSPGFKLLLRKESWWLRQGPDRVTVGSVRSEGSLPQPTPGQSRNCAVFPNQHFTLFVEDFDSLRRNNGSGVLPTRRKFSSTSILRICAAPSCLCCVMRSRVRRPPRLVANGVVDAGAIFRLDVWSRRLTSVQGASVS